MLLYFDLSKLLPNDDTVASLCNRTIISVCLLVCTCKSTVHEAYESAISGVCASASGQLRNVWTICRFCASNVVVLILKLVALSVFVSTLLTSTWVLYLFVKVMFCRGMVFRFVNLFWTSICSWSIYFLNRWSIRVEALINYKICSYYWRVIFVTCCFIIISTCSIFAFIFCIYQ